MSGPRRRDGHPSNPRPGRLSNLPHRPPGDPSDRSRHHRPDTVSRPLGTGRPHPPGTGSRIHPGTGRPHPLDTGPPDTGAPGYGQPYPPGYGQPGQLPPGQQAGAAWGQPTAWGPPPAAPKPGIVPLRPLGVGELLDGALSLIRSNPRTVLGLAAVISAVSALIQTAGLWISLRYLESMTPVVGSADEVDITAELTTLVSGSVAQIVPALVAGFLQVLASGLFIVLVGAAVLGRRLDASQTWATLRPRLLRLIGVTLIITAGGFVAVGLLIGSIVALAFAIGPWAVLPGVVIGVGGVILLVYVYVKLAVASPALVMEGTGVLTSLSRSWVLVRRSWWRVLGILILAAVITSLLTTVVTIPITLIATLVSGFSESFLPTVVASGVATLVAGIITLPFSAAVTGLLYIDLRMRREALDIELVSAGVHPSEDPLAAYRTQR